jgi:hypothetical protein
MCLLNLILIGAGVIVEFIERATPGDSLPGLVFSLGTALFWILQLVRRLAAIFS